MPVTPVFKNGTKVGYRYGSSGTLYKISEHGNHMAKMKAIKQGHTIRKSQERQGKHPEAGPLVK